MNHRPRPRLAPAVLLLSCVAWPVALVAPASASPRDPGVEATEVHPPDEPERPRCLYPAWIETAAPPPGARAPAGGASPIYRIVNRFHVIRRSDGSGGLPTHLIDFLMRDLNHGYRDTSLRWVREPEIRYIDNDSYYADLPNLNVIFAIFQQHFDTGVVNWFLTPSIFQGQFVGYTSPGGPQSAGERGQVLINQAIGRPTNISTPPHEMGHLFFLWHPFETQFGVECTSGGNCSFAGDRVCDTPASPCLHSGNITGTGIFFGSEPVPCSGDPPWNPDGRLYMDCGWPAGHILRDRFSPGQLERLESFLFSISSDLIHQAPDVLVDCDSNGVDDLDEILAGSAVDLGRDMVPDVCQVFPAPGDLLVSGMNPGEFNRPRFYDGGSGAYRGDMWNGLTWVHQLRFGPDGYVYLTRLNLVVRMDVRTARNVDVLVDGLFEGAGTFVDLLFDEQGDLLVLDNVASNIRRYSKTGQYLGLFVQLSTTVGMTSPKYMERGPDGNIHVVGSGSRGNTIQVLDGQSGVPLGSLIPPGSGGLNRGQGITFRDGDVFVSNASANNVLRYDAASGTFRGVFVGSASGGLNNPHSLRFGPDGHLYVASRGTHSVKRYDGRSGAYLGDFVAARSGGPEGTGGLDQPAGLLFCTPAGSVADLRLDRSGAPASGDAQLSWSLPPGGAPLPTFDTLRSAAPDDFGAAECLEASGEDGFAVDPGAPEPAAVRYFLVRSGNVCGPSPVVPGSGGRPRNVASCDPVSRAVRGDDL